MVYNGKYINLSFLQGVYGFGENADSFTDEYY